MLDAPLVPILNIGVHVQSFDSAIQILIDWAYEPRGRYVCMCPVYTLMLATERPDVRAAVDGADMVSADGMPLVWLQRRRGFGFAERVYGPDVLLALCEQTAGLGVRHLFLGGDSGVADQLAASLQVRFPMLQVVGSLAPNIEDPSLDPQLVTQIMQESPQIVWVGLGSPKQDLWMAVYRPALPVLMIGVGAAFDFLTGRKRQAPRWLRNSGMEWLFRLLHEPNRLWKRYLLYNPRFVWAVLREEWQNRCEKNSDETD